MMAWTPKIYRRGPRFNRAPNSRHRDWILISHKPLWVPAMLRINAAGDTKPGFECAHLLENGNGQCGGNVFRIEDAIGDHTCGKIIVFLRCHRVKHSRKWKRLK